MRGNKGKCAETPSSSWHGDSSSSGSGNGGSNGDNCSNAYDDQPKHSSGPLNSSQFREMDGWSGSKGGGGKARNTATAAGAAGVTSSSRVASLTPNAAGNKGAAKENDEGDEHGATAGMNRRARSGRLKARKAAAVAVGAGSGTHACATTISSANNSGGDDGDESYEASEEEVVDADADRVGPSQAKGHGRSASRRKGAAAQIGDSRSRRSAAARAEDNEKDDKPCRTRKSTREGRPVTLPNAPATRPSKKRSHRRRSAAPASSGDDDDCLRNSSSEGTVSDSSGGGDGGDGGDGSPNEPVLCRCGAQHWKDGDRWIRCDGRGCWTWEHFRCAYPATRGAKEGEPEEEKLPSVHLCQRCKAKGSAEVVRSLARGDGTSTEAASPEPSPKNASSSAGSTRKPNKDDEVGGSSVRRSSRRVSGRESIRPLFQRRGNVIGAAESASDTSEGEPGGASFDAVGGNGSDGSDGEFWAPEGEVEVSQEFRCRCGSTREDERIRGGGGDDDGSGGEDARWVQCRSDSCGIWEHAACCDYGCCSGGDRARGSPTRVEKRRFRRLRHWCRGCDPKGKKHAKSEEKRRNRERLRAGKGARGAAARATKEMCAAALQDLEAVRRREKTALMGKADVLRCRLWRAVKAGDATLVEQVLCEAGRGKGGDGKHTDLVLRRLLEAEPPPLGNCLGTTVGLDGGGGGAAAAVRVDGVGSGALVFPPCGVTLLMFAAGYWSLDGGAFAAASVSLVQANSCEMASRRHSCAVVEGAESAEGRGAASPAGATVYTEGIPENARFNAGAGSETRATTEEAQAHDTTRGSKQDGGDPTTTEPHVLRVRDTSGASESSVPGLGSEPRLAVLRELLVRSDDRTVLDVDEDGRTAAHHAAAAGGALEVALLLKGEPGREAALTRVR